MHTKKISYALLTFFALLCSLMGNTQIITNAEYFINADPGTGNGIVIPGVTGNTINAGFTIRASSLQPGFNQLFIRIQDSNNNWSIAEQRTFYIDALLHSTLPAISAAEYFFDVDPGTGNASPLAIQNSDSIIATLNIATSGLQAGFHQLFIRIKDQFNNWSIAEQRAYYIDNSLHALLPALTSVEYFIDTDPGAGNGTPLNISASDSIRTIFNINASILTGGFHQLFIRTKDKYSNWSIAEQRTFYIDSNLYHKLIPLVASEYFINADNGVGTGTPVNIARADSTNGSYDFIPSNLPVGKYVMSFRAQDSSGNWSIGESRPFTLCATSGAKSGFEFSIADYRVTFTNTSTYASSYHWIFGDGDTSNAVNPVHVYKAGLYKACLISKDDCRILGDTSCKSIAANAVLPVTVANVHINCANDKTVLSWQTLSEMNSGTFQIQRSIDGSTGWSTIGGLNAAGYSTTVKQYQFTDISNGVTFYRLRMTDKDGKQAYSEVYRSSCVLSGMDLKIYPIPSNAEFTIEITSGENGQAVISLTDVSGKLIRQINRNLQTGNNVFTINTSGITPGEYFLKLQGAKILITEKIVILH